MLPKAAYVVDRAYNDYGWPYSLRQLFHLDRRQEKSRKEFHFQINFAFFEVNQAVVPFNTIKSNDDDRKSKAK